MQSGIVLVFVFLMFISAFFLTNFRKSEIAGIPPASLPFPLVHASAARNGRTAAPKRLAPPAPPELPPAEAQKTPAAAGAAANAQDQLFYTVSSYSPDPEAPPIFQEALRGPVCVQIDNREGRAIVTKYMTESEAAAYGKYYDYAVLFLKNACARFVSASSPVYFVKNDGTEVSQDGVYGFILFDGVNEPYTAQSIFKIKDAYYSYFGNAPETKGDPE